MSDSSVFLGVIFSGTRRSDVMVRLLPHSHDKNAYLSDLELILAERWLCIQARS